MTPARLLALIGLAAACTALGCFPPIPVLRVAEPETPTGATPWPSGFRPSPRVATPGPAASATPSAAP